MYADEAKDLRRRMAHFRSPGPSQATNLRLNALLRADIASSCRVEVEFVDHPEIRTASHWGPLDLADRPARLLVDNTALLIAGTAGVQVHHL